MTKVYEIFPCGSKPDTVTSLIQTRVFTVLGPVSVDCLGAVSFDEPTSCNMWATALQDLSVDVCSNKPPPEVDTSIPPEEIAFYQEVLSYVPTYSSKYFAVNITSQKDSIEFVVLNNPGENTELNYSWNLYYVGFSLSSFSSSSTIKAKGSTSFPSSDGGSYTFPHFSDYRGLPLG